MPQRSSWRVVALLAPLLLTACATPSSSPDSLRRLDPAASALLDAARRSGPLSLDDIVRKSREGVGAAALIDEIRRTATHHALTPAETQRLRDQGVAQAVLDELVAAQERWARDEATAAKVRRDTAQAAAEDRARAEEERRRRTYYGPTYSPYYDPFWPHGYPSGRFGYGGFGWGGYYRR